MHVIFKDARGRILDGRTGVAIEEHDVWLPGAPEAIVCEVYEHRESARGPLVAVFVRDERTGTWSRRSTVDTPLRPPPLG